MALQDFLQLGGEPGPGDVQAYFLVEPVPGETIYNVAAAIAAESSVGTWTELGQTPHGDDPGLRARVIELQGHFVKITYPAAIFEPGNIPAFVNTLIGDVFGLRTVRRLRLLDIHVPQCLVQSFPGPFHGRDAVRGRLGGIKDRPLVAAIIKPRLGLTVQEQADMVRDALSNGCDLVEDDEKLAGQGSNPFYERVPRCLEAQKQAEARLGRPLAYIPNITAPLAEMLRRAEFVARHGGAWVAVDALAAGWSALQELRAANAELGLILHANRAGHAVFTRSPDFGVSMLVLAKLCRLAGVDEIHIDPVVGKTGGSEGEAGLLQHNLVGDVAGVQAPYLPQAWHGLKPVMPVVSGGLSPVSLPSLWAIFGTDVMLQFGGGIHGHPGGTGAGARAVRQALEAAMAGIPLEAAAARCPELHQALEKWRFAAMKHAPLPPVPHTPRGRGAHSGR